MGTAKERAMIVTLSNGNCFNFYRFASGLYYYYTTKYDDDKATNDTHKLNKF